MHAIVGPILTPSRYFVLPHDEPEYPPAPEEPTDAELHALADVAHNAPVASSVAPLLTPYLDLLVYFHARTHQYVPVIPGHSRWGRLDPRRLHSPTAFTDKEAARRWAIAQFLLRYPQRKTAPIVKWVAWPFQYHIQSSHDRLRYQQYQRARATRQQQARDHALTHPHLPRRFRSCFEVPIPIDSRSIPDKLATLPPPPRLSDVFDATGQYNALSYTEDFPDPSLSVDDRVVSWAEHHGFIHTRHATRGTTSTPEESWAYLWTKSGQFSTLYYQPGWYRPTDAVNEGPASHDRSWILYTEDAEGFHLWASVLSLDDAKEYLESHQSQLYSPLRGITQLEPRGSREVAQRDWQKATPLWLSPATDRQFQQAYAMARIRSLFAQAKARQSAALI